ncbi:MAG: hypothetical protein Q8K37_02970, partial [Alphaproteobacteria bacterium]|nr:hypothetical protein [Alphaproteobacteria bacterium]
MHKKFTITFLLSSILICSALFAGGSDDEENDFSMSYNMDFGSDYMSSMLELDTDLINMNSTRHDATENRNNNIIHIDNNKDEDLILNESKEIFNSIMMDGYNHEKFIILTQNTSKHYNDHALPIIENYKEFVQTVKSVNEEGRINILNAAKILHPKYNNIYQNNEKMNNFCNTINALLFCKKNEVISIAELIQKLDPKNQLDTKKYQSIINPLAHLQPERRFLIVNAIKNIKSDDWKTEDYSNAIQKLAQFDPQLIGKKDFIFTIEASKEIFNLLKSESMDTFYPIAVAFSKTKEEIRIPIIEEIKYLHTHNNKESNWINLINSFVD